MKSKIISVLLCILVLAATFWLTLKAPIDIKETESETQTEPQTENEPIETEVTRTFVIKTAHDAEDLMEELAYNKIDNFENRLSDLVTRLSRSSEFLKVELKDRKSVV